MGQPKHLVVDCDLHNAFGANDDLLPYLDAPWREQWSAIQYGLGPVYWTPIGKLRKDAVPPSGAAPASDPAYVLRHYMDPYGIDYAVLMGEGINSINVLPSIDYANALMRAYNDWMIDQWLSASPRFLGSIVVNPADPAASVTEIRRLGATNRVVQIMMGSGSTALFGQREFHPIYEAACEHGLRVAIHPGSEGKGIAGHPTPSGYPASYFEWHNILPTNFMAHVNSMICEGVFEKFPEMIVIAVEGGVTWVPHLMWRMDKNFKALRATAPWLKHLPSYYFAKNLRLTTQPIEEPFHSKDFQVLMDMIGGQDILLFSSDYPHWDFDSPISSLPAMTPEFRANLLGENAAKVYGLSGRVCT